jgi:methyl-accepting chemotaxis protein
MNNGENWLAASFPLPELGMVVFAAIPESEIFASYNANSQKVFLISLLIGAVAIAFVIAMAGTIVKPIKQVTQQLTQLSRNHDLSTRITVADEAEIGQLANSFNQFLTSLNQAFLVIRSSSLQVEQSAHDNAAEATFMGSQVEDQKSNMLALTDSFHSVLGQADNIDESANEAAKYSQHVAENMESVNLAITSSTQSMDELAQEIDQSSRLINEVAGDVESINTIVDVITSISDQTNLLALNAAIEAARAGDAGRGFAVVADEVRNLSVRTNQSTAEIRDMISRLQLQSRQASQSMASCLNMTHSSVESVNQAGITLSHTAEEVTAIATRLQDIARLADGQNAEVKVIEKLIDGLAQSCSRQQHHVEKTTMASQAFVEEAKSVSCQTEKFQLQEA